ncbi:MAG: hypothetical protein ABWZ85_13720 [Luteibacter sp.]
MIEHPPHTQVPEEAAAALSESLIRLACADIPTEYPPMENRLNRLELTAAGIDNRLLRVEVTVGHIKEDVRDLRIEVRSVRDQARVDFRLLFGALVSVALGMAALMAKGFHWI